MRLRHFLLLLALASPLANAMKAVFWQPQLRDNAVSAPQWHSLMQSLQQQGFDTLVLQWTRYGDAFADAQEQTLLHQRADAARAVGLRVIVGLHGDPEFFQRQKQRGTALTHYLARLRVADVQQAKNWAMYDGWYLSAEIDDLNWRNPATREQLLEWLKNTQGQLTAVGNKPVYISSFFAGNMAPEGYRQMLSEIHQLGIKVWVQDGHGVNTMNSSERQRYLDASTGCAASTPASGIVYEIFRVNPGKTFSAEPLSSTEIASRLAQRSDCGKDSVYFSLRYLPVAKGVLAYQ
ncbi:DUF4434 family protein [Kluyvera sp. STS39-E]|uniref:DUF4434 family protein n=1 Tax=Kluyvera sp. STS39-E TaxID=3234748 RepID=UPI0034C5EA0F